MEDRKKKMPSQKHSVYILLAGLVIIIVMTLLWWLYYTKSINQNGRKELQNTVEYDRHYVMITEDSSSALWQDIFQSAKTAAAQSGACLEMLGEWGQGEYSILDYMNIALAAKVDGIIVKPDGTMKMREAINEAELAGIPVITVLEDDSTSSRRSFVGINSYQLGTMYGEQILDCMESSTRKITVLLNRGDAGRDLVYKQLKATVEEGLPKGREVEISSMGITPGSTFNVEEVIRDLLHNEKTRPDILVCMNETDSECAYYAMVDYNLVDNMQLIGYYLSDIMLGAVQKGVIPVVITLDTDQVGEYSVEALEEYYNMGYVSNYFSVDLNIITRLNAARFQKEEAE